MYKKCRIIKLLATPNDETSKGIWVAKHRDWCHLFITSDEEIKYDDYYISDGVIYVLTTKPNGKNPKKIIATTDTSLEVATNTTSEYDSDSKTICCNIPQIPQQFIQYYIDEYNKGNVITEVEVDDFNQLVANHL